MPAPGPCWVQGYRFGVVGDRLFFACAVTKKDNRKDADDSENGRRQRKWATSIRSTLDTPWWQAARSIWSNNDVIGGTRNGRDSLGCQSTDGVTSCRTISNWGDFAKYKFCTWYVWFVWMDGLWPKVSLSAPASIEYDIMQYYLVWYTAVITCQSAVILSYLCTVYTCNSWPSALAGTGTPLL